MTKKIRYVLLVSVTIIWGLILYRIFIAIIPGAENLAEASPVQQPFEINNNINIVDTFSIKANYRDPFLGNGLKHTSKPVKSQKKSKGKKTHIPMRPDKALAWPSVEFLGTIKNVKADKEIVILRVEGKGGLLNVGDTLNGVKIAKLLTDSVELSFKGSRKIIAKME